MQLSNFVELQNPRILQLAPVSEIQFGTISVRAKNLASAKKIAVELYHEGRTEWNQPHVHIGGELSQLQNPRVLQFNEVVKLHPTQADSGVSCCKSTSCIIPARGSERSGAAELMSFEITSTRIRKQYFPHCRIQTCAC
jgi:hypothetical protein